MYIFLETFSGKLAIKTLWILLLSFWKKIVLVFCEIFAQWYLLRQFHLVLNSNQTIFCCFKVMSKITSLWISPFDWMGAKCEKINRTKFSWYATSLCNLFQYQGILLVPCSHTYIDHSLLNSSGLIGITILNSKSLNSLFLSTPLVPIASICVNAWTKQCTAFN